MSKKADLCCVTFYWNNGDGPYSADYVNKLFNGIDRNLSKPHRNICFTDQPEGIREGIEIFPLDTRAYKGNLKKAIMFKRGLLTGRVLSFDVDNLITGPLDILADHPGEFVIYRAPAQPRRRQGKNGGNLIAFNADSMHEQIWEPLERDYLYYEKATGGYEKVLLEMFMWPDRMEFWDETYVSSYKRQVKPVNDDPAAWPDLRLLAMHGPGYRPHEVKNEWTQRFWR